MNEREGKGRSIRIWIRKRRIYREKERMTRKGERMKVRIEKEEHEIGGTENKYKEKVKYRSF